MDFTSIISVLCKLFALLALGYFLNKRKILDTHINGGISSLMVNATNPALILSSISATGNSNQSDIMRLILFGVIFYAILVLLAFILVRVLRVPNQKRSTVQLLLVFSNTGFMAIPVVQTLYGDIAVFYCTILNLPFNFLIYSYGVYLLSKSSGSGKKLSFRQFLSPGIIASALALLIYFTGFRIPTVINDTFSFLGNITPPLSMLLLGSVLAEYPLSSMWQNKRINLLLLIKLLLLPFLAFFLTSLFFTDPVIIGVTTLTFAMPCASMCVMLCKEYKGDSRTASVGVVFSTLLSLITIPIIFLLLLL